jgi:crotonobetainyl-CoA:carnitine CoA-transferase CaiB-like acyl-CoA transferase
VREPAPLLGQHTDEILQTYLQMSQTEIAELRRVGIIGKQKAPAPAPA